MNPNLTICNNLSTSEFEITSVNIYPNPTADFVQIESKNIIDKIEVFNILGKRISVTAVPEVDLSQQPNGVYVLKIHSDEKTLTKKVVKN